MKTKVELLELINQAILNNGSTYNQWFIGFSGHINAVDISYYQGGWNLSQETGSNPDKVNVKLNEEGSIQEGYWFIKNRL